MVRRLRFVHLLWSLFLAGFGTRLAYVIAQIRADPEFSLPILDGAYYLEWARALAEGRGGPLAGHPAELPSAFYLAPLYPLLLSGFLRLFGDNFALLYYVQQLLVLAAAGFLVVAGRRLVGDAAGLAAGLMLLLYHPALFFASRPLGEALALLLLTGALAAQASPARLAGAGAGLLGATAALVRPNLLLVPLVWAVEAALRRRWVRFALTASAMLVALAPTTVRNLAAAGHLVAVSSNGGLTLYHGNGPGARGIGWNVPGLSGRLAEQQREATRLASFFAGRELDPVEADRFWARRAIAARGVDLPDSLALVARRAGLVLGNEELSVDYAPLLDMRPWRWLAPLPFACVLGLAAAGLCLGGVRGSGGWTAWGTILACAATPLVFYVSSRYRLPLAAALMLPAGAGLAGLTATARETTARRRGVSLAVAAGVAALSFLVPTGEVGRISEAAARVNRASVWEKKGDLERAEQELKRALELDPDSAPALRRISEIFDRTGRSAEFGPYYQRGLALEASTLEARWSNVILEAVVAGDPLGAARAADEAERRGVELAPGLREKLQAAIDRQGDARATKGAEAG